MITPIRTSKNKPLLFFISLIIFSVIPILLPCASFSAETLYVKPSAEIPVRRGQGTSYKIVSIVKNGDSVELLGEENSYARVRLKNNKEGWIVRRFLSKEPPLENVVEALKEENNSIKEQAEYTAQNLVEVSTALQQTKEQLKTLTAENDQLKSDYKELQADTADVVEIKKSQQAATEANKELQEQLANLVEENEELKSNETKQWFLMGGGVLLLGILLGKLPGPSRKRKPSLLQ